MPKLPYEQPSYFDETPDDLAIDKWQKTVDVLTEIFDAPGAWIMQANVKGLEAILASESMQHRFPAGTKYGREQNIYCKTVIESKEILYVKNANIEGEWGDNPEYTEAGYNSYLGVPLQWPDGEMFGTLCVLDVKETNYPDKFIDLMWQLKEHIDSDLRSIMLIEKLRQASKTDELTGINNRRGFMEDSERLISLAKRNNMSLSLMYFDLNDLKQVNDIYGHEAGDLLIKLFAEALKQSVRAQDIIARLSGDEFCCFCIHKLCDTEETITSRIQSQFENLTKNDANIRAPSFSAGYKVFNQTNEFNIERMLSQTDTLMYANKRARKIAKESIDKARSRKNS